jgi:hypothetical protein
MNPYRAPSNFRGPLPQKVKATLIYNQASRLINTGGLANAATKVYSCNDIRDPTHLGVSQQPRGFDEMMAMYDHFVVIGAKLEIWCENTANTSAVFGCTIRDTLSVNTVIRDYMEGRMIKCVNLSGGSRANQSTDTVQHSGGPSTGYLSLSVNPNKWLGVAAPLSSLFTRGDTANSPEEQCHFHLFAGNLDIQNSSTVQVNYHVRISYDVILLEPKNVAAS